MTERITFVEKDINVLAFCPECREVLGQTTDRNQIETRMFKEKLWRHIYEGKEIHDVDIIYLRRKSEQVLSGRVYITNPISLTIIAEGYKRLVSSH